MCFQKTSSLLLVDLAVLSWCHDMRGGGGVHVREVDAGGVHFDRRELLFLTISLFNYADVNVVNAPGKALKQHADMLLTFLMNVMNSLLGIRPSKVELNFL